MLGIALLAQIASSLVTQGIPTLAPFLQEDLGLTRGQVGLFNSALMAGSFTSLFAAGALVDSRGERAALVCGNVIIGAACAAILATHGFISALLVLVIAGIGASFPTPAGSKAVMRWFPLAQRGTAMGVRQTGIPLGGALAAATLPALAVHHGWRIAVVVSGIFAFLTAALCFFGYRDERPAHEILTRPSAPLSFREVLTRDIALMGLAGALLPLGQFALVTYLALYLKETQGIPVTTTATLLVAAQLAGAAGRVLWGVWSDRWFGQRRKPALITANVLAAGLSLVLGWLPVETPFIYVAIIVVCYAFNTIGWHGNWISILAEIAGPERQGRTIGAAMTVMYGGIIMLPPLFGVFVDYTHSWRWAWTILAGMILLGTALTLPVREHGYTARD